MYIMIMILFFFFKQKTAYEMRISDWSSDVCSSDLVTQQNASSSEELAATAEEMSSQAEQLQQAMSFFTLDAPAKSASLPLKVDNTPGPASRKTVRASAATMPKAFA